MQKKFSYPLTVADLPQAEQHYRLRAEEADCRYLAEVLQLPAVNRLEADLRLKNNHAEGMLDVSGHVFAGIKLESVISLELFDQNYDFDFSLRFDTRATYASQREEAEDWTADLPDVVVGGKIDLADIVIEQIALRLDDYPRRPGEVFVFDSEFDDGTEDKHNPFDVLAKLKK